MKASLKKKNIKNVCVIVALLALIALSIVSLVNIKALFIHSETKQLENLDVIYNNIYIRGRAVGGLTVEQATNRMDTAINGEYVNGEDKIITFRTSTGFEKTFSYAELGMRFNVEDAVNEAYAIGRNGDDNSKRSVMADLDVGGKYLDAEYTYDLDNVKDCLRTIEADVNKSLESIGKTMDVDKTAAAADEMLRVNEYGSTIVIWTK
jgi:hypothetical protein